VSTTRTYSTMTRSLGALRDWLVAEGVTVVGMESTSTYWMRGVLRVGERPAVLAAQRRAPQGGAGAEDLRDAEWIAQLLECGLVPHPRVRNLTRYRADGGTATPAGWRSCWRTPSIKISAVASNILGRVLPGYAGRPGGRGA